MVNCRDCVHWDRENAKRDSGFPKDWHVCLRIKEMWRATDWDDDGKNSLKPENANDLALVNDGSSYKAELITNSKFGCVYGEGR